MGLEVDVKQCKLFVKHFDQFINSKVRYSISWLTLFQLESTYTYYDL